MKRISYVVFFLLFSAGAYAHTYYSLERAFSADWPSDEPVYIQMGYFSTEQRAESFKEKLQSTVHHNVSIERSGTGYKVLVGPFVSKGSAKALNLASSQVAKPRFLVMDSSTWFFSGEVGGQLMGVRHAPSVNNGSGLNVPFNQDLYQVINNSSSAALGGALGYRWLLDNQFFRFLSISAQYQHFFSGRLDGQIVQFRLPEFTNYDYTLSTDVNLIVANLKLNFVPYRIFSAYLNGGLGSAISHTEQYTETGLNNVTPRASPNWASRTKAEFSYILGAGLDIDIASPFILSIAYQFSALGNLSTGRGQNLWGSQSLNFGNAESNMVLLSLTYLIDSKHALSQK